MSSSLALVSVQPNLASDIKRQEIIKQIQDRITELNLRLPDYKNNTEFVLLVLNLVEHLVKKKYKIDKKKLAIHILSTLLNLGPQEVSALETNIEFLHSNKMIKKVSKFWAFCCGVGEYFTGTKKG